MRVMAELPRGRMSNAAVIELVRTTWDTAFIEGRRDGADAADHFKAERDRLLALTKPPASDEGGPTGLDWYLALNQVRLSLADAVIRLEMQTSGGPPRVKEIGAALAAVYRARGLVEVMGKAAADEWVEGVGRKAGVRA